MYKFIDTTQVQTEKILPSEALQINGEYIENIIPEYRTLNVSGREALSPELSLFETGIRDGSTLQSRRYPSRTITVSYSLIAKSNDEFREAYNRLGEILNVENAQLIFADESDKYFIGTPSVLQDVEPGRNAVTGEIEFFCADPFKYSVLEYEAKADEAENNILLDYNGTYRSYPVLISEFYKEEDFTEDGETSTELTGTGDCGYVAFVNEDEKIIQLGKPDEADTESLPASQTLVNSAFSKSGSWGTAAKKIWKVNSGITSSSDVDQSGNVKIGTAGKQYYLKPSNFGSGDKWHGPTITRELPSDKSGIVGATNWTLTFVPKISVGKNATSQRGFFQLLLVDKEKDDKKIVAGFSIFKTKNGNNAHLRFYINGSIAKTTTTNVAYSNKNFNGSKASSITKSGKTVTFAIGNKKYSFTDEDITNVATKQVVVGMGQWKQSAPLSFNGLRSIKFVKNNCATLRDIPNQFSANDILEVDCSTGEILLNGISSPGLGALGNDWEDFVLKPGLNQIGVAYSEWLTGDYVPKMKIRYREVFL